MSLTEILTKCRSTTDQVRNGAEQELDNLATQNFGKLLEDCAAEMADESKLKENRQLCGTLIKNMVVYNNKHLGKWEQLDPELKMNVKNMVLSCLASSQKDIRKAAASTVAGIGRIEIPRGEWPQIINILIQTSANKNPNFRMASIVTIGYISQELLPGHLSTEDVDNILSALINNMTSNTDLEILSHAIIAFLNFLIFAKKNFEIANEREVIFKVIFESLQNPNLDIRVYAMQCLVEISRIYYDFLDSHIEKLIQITEHFMRTDDERVSIQAYEFWCSISDQEVLLLNQTGTCRFFSLKALDSLWEVTKLHLLNRSVDKERLDEDAWTNVKAASVLLTNLCQCTDERLIDKVFGLISENITSEQPKIRDSVILAFGSILETTHRDKIRLIIPEAIPTLLNMLKDKSVEVRSTMAWAIKKITEYHTECLANFDIFEIFITTIIQNLSSNKKVVVQLCNSINFLATNLRSDPSVESSGYFSKHMKTLLENLLTIAFTKDAYDVNNNVALAAFFSMGTLIDYAPLDTYVIVDTFFHENIPRAFESTLNLKNFNSDEVRFAYQSYIATVISACAAAEKVKLTSEYATWIYGLIKASFQERQAVYEEGLMACSSISLALGQNFSVLISDFFTYLVWALQQWQDVNLCRISINCTSDLIRSMGPLMDPYMPQLIPIILDILENANSDKYLKTQALIIITDMFCFTREEALKQYNKIILIINTALQAALYIPEKNEDTDLIEYFRSLREHLLECITCIIHCLKDINRMDLFNEYVASVLDFVTKISEENYEPSLETIAGCLGIIGDMCECYHTQIKPLINQNACSYLINKLKQSGARKYEKLWEWSAMTINQTLISD